MSFAACLPPEKERHDRIRNGIEGEWQNTATIQPVSCLALETKWKLRKSSMLSIERTTQRMCSYMWAHRALGEPNLNLISINIQCILLPNHNSCVAGAFFLLLFCSVCSRIIFIFIICVVYCVVGSAVRCREKNMYSLTIKSESESISIRYTCELYNQPFVCSMPNMIWFSSFRFDGNLSQLRGGGGVGG